MLDQDKCFVSEEKAKQVANYLAKNSQKVKSAKGINAYLNLFAEASGFTGHQKVNKFLASLSQDELQSAPVQESAIVIDEQTVDTLFSYWVSYFGHDKKEKVNKELIEKFPDVADEELDVMGNICAILEEVGCDEVFKSVATLDKSRFDAFRSIFEKYFVAVFGEDKAISAQALAFGSGEWADIIVTNASVFKVSIDRCNLSNGELFETFEVLVKAETEGEAEDLALSMVNTYKEKLNAEDFHVDSVKVLGGFELHFELFGADSGTQLFTNHYVCNFCQEIWSVDGCDSMHNDKCGGCNREYTPYLSVDENTGWVVGGCELLSFEAEFSYRIKGEVVKKDCVWLPECLFLVDGDQYLLKNDNSSRNTLKVLVSEMWEGLSEEDVEEWDIISYSGAEICIVSPTRHKKVCLNRLYD